MIECTVNPQFVASAESPGINIHTSAAATLLKALANESRLLILCTLRGKEMSVGELNVSVPLSQSALSQHLASLREAGLVSTRKKSQTVFYRLEGTEATQVISVLQSIYRPTEMAS